MPAPASHRLLIPPSSALRLLRLLLWCASLVLALAALAWGGVALAYRLPGPPWLGPAGGGLWALAWLGVAGYSLRRGRLLLLWSAGLLLAAGLLLWWGTLRPASERDWADDVARLTQIRTDPERPDLVQLQDVRNFRWRSDTDYTARWETRQYDLSQLESVDLALSYWMGPAIAHTLVSFGFHDGRHVVFSIEIRKERGEQYSALAGFFKQYEMALIAADERDILAVRTNVRDEEVHLYRVNLDRPAMRALFLGYARQAAQLQLQPRFYNTLTANCTTIVYGLARQVVQGLPLDVRLLLSGYLPEYLAQVGGLTPGMPLDGLRSVGDITLRAQQWQAPAQDPDTAASIDFSRWIRRGIPPLQP